jgi:putative ABC transport system permease protein
MLNLTRGLRFGPGRRSTGAPFDMDDAEAIQEQVRSVYAVAPQASTSATAIVGNENWSTSVTGITDGFLIVRDRPVSHGRAFTKAEYRSGKAVCIIGATVRKELYGRLDPVGEKLRLGKLSCEVVGLVQEKGQSTFGTDQDNLVLIPLRTYQRRIAGNTDINMIQISVREGYATDKAKRDIVYLMRDRRRIDRGEDDDFSVMDMKEIADMLSSTTRVLTMLLGAVAAVSLLVGGIGIMNIMLVSVTERTKEIGIRLAIGALEREVLLQFLVEAVVLSSFGGLVGITLALLASYFLSNMMQVPFVLDLSIVLLAFVFSAAVGVFFGYFPARRAAHLDPIDALRHE